ncbi:MAG TPA: xyloglucanase [Opitutaceae bacterium]|jgi:photosystem II stability/assembly factor-like uncharacterized protein|nr:xyloglucanase [Opitutaceae bacterium]
MTKPRVPALLSLIALACLAAFPAAAAPAPGVDHYTFKNVAIGGGGFVTGIIFNPSEKGLVYARTDVGGAYRMDAKSGAWVPLLDWAGQKDWNLYGVESLATDPVDPRRVYIAAGTYTNARVSNGELLRSEDYGANWKRSPLPFKFGGNEAGRGNGERLVVDPNDNKVLFLGTRNDGLWRSHDFGANWSHIESFPDIDEVLPSRDPGSHVYVPQHVGINIILFDSRTGSSGSPTPVIYAAASTPNASIFRSTDIGRHWAPIEGEPLGLRPIRMALSKTGILYIAYGKESGPNSITDGAVWKFNTASGEWMDVTPERPSEASHFGYASVSVDAKHPDTVVVGTWNHYSPLDEIFRSLDGGKTWKAILGEAKWDHSSAPYTESMNRHWLASTEIDPFDPDHAMFTTGFGVWVTHNLTAADSGRPTLWSFEDRGIEETVPLVLVSPPEGAHLLSGVGDVDGFRHDNLDVSPPSGRFGTPPFKNTASMAFAWNNPQVIVRAGNTYHNDIVTAAYSMDGGVSWKSFVSEPPGTLGPYWRGEGTITISPDAKTVVWSPTGVPANYTNDWGKTWFPSVNGSINLAVAADTVNPLKFFAYDTESGSVVESTDGAKSFKGTFAGLPVVKGRWGPSPGRLYMVPGREGELFVIADGQLLHSRDSGHTLEGDKDIQASHVGFGKGAPGSPYPAIFISAVINDQDGLFRSDDDGVTWIRINDDSHGFGEIRTIIGDPRIYGRVYIGTGGRGILYGDRTSR